MNSIKRIINFFIFCLILSSCKDGSYEDSYVDKAQLGTSEYVGSNTCINCHKESFNDWQGSHHDLAMQIANEATVLGDFNNVTTKIDGVDYFFFKENNEFYVRIKEVDSSENNYKIAYTFGVTPLQQYLIDFDKGKKQVLRVTWDVIKKQWYHQYKDETIQPNDWLHWTNGAQNWNTMCAECHSTNLKKNYLVDEDIFKTTYSEINVACESCHGPARNHVSWANKNTSDKNTYILKGTNQKDQLSLCASCHARRVKLTENLTPGIAFEDQYQIQNITNNFYHSDGQIDDEDYVYGSFLQSKMYAEGVKCTDCHNPHTLKLKFEGNMLCTQCHVSTDYDTKQHHFHSENTEESLCINCHMTGKDYMGNDFRRDHSFRIPRPDQSEKYGTPNACIGCHQDKTNTWAADWIKEWYGNKRPEHFSDALLLSNQNTISTKERQQLDAFINDLNFPSIARATVIENLDYNNREQFGALIKALNDSSAIIRYNALLKFRNLPLQDRTSIALKHITDSVKLVRIGAAQLFVGIDESKLNQIDKTNFINARAELETMLYSNADFSNGRMQLGDYYLQNNDINTAIKHYEMALEKDNLLIPVYSNLATAYSINKNQEKASETLNIWMNLEPNSGRPHYLKALLNFEIGEDENAISELKIAIQLNPNDTRSMYNLATYYFQDKKDLGLAETYIKSALKIVPNNTDYKYLLALIYRDQGKFKSGQKIMQELRVNQQ
jgi:predicted CXXCH cytochrome family protein